MRKASKNAGTEQANKRMKKMNSMNAMSMSSKSDETKMMSSKQGESSSSQMKMRMSSKIKDVKALRLSDLAFKGKVPKLFDDKGKDETKSESDELTSLPETLSPRMQNLKKKFDSRVVDLVIRNGYKSFDDLNSFKAKHCNGVKSYLKTGFLIGQLHSLEEYLKKVALGTIVAKKLADVGAGFATNVGLTEVNELSKLIDGGLPNPKPEAVFLEKLGKSCADLLRAVYLADGLENLGECFEMENWGVNVSNCRKNIADTLQKGWTTKGFRDLMLASKPVEESDANVAPVVSGKGKGKGTRSPPTVEVTIEGKVQRLAIPRGYCWDCITKQKCDFNGVGVLCKRGLPQGWSNVKKV